MSAIIAFVRGSRSVGNNDGSAGRSGVDVADVRNNPRSTFDTDVEAALEMGQVGTGTSLDESIDGTSLAPDPNHSPTVAVGDGNATVSRTLGISESIYHQRHSQLTIS